MAREPAQSALSYTAAGRKLAASAKIFERLTRRYDKPAFDLATTAVDGKIVPIVEQVAWERPFCKLLHFEKQFDARAPELRQKLLIVAPMAGHHAWLRIAPATSSGGFGLSCSQQPPECVTL